MGSVTTGTPNYTVFEEICADFLAQRKAEAQARDKLLGMAWVLRVLLKTKFGRVPKWAEARIKTASRLQLKRWALRVYTEEKLEDVIPRT